MTMLRLYHLQDDEGDECFITGVDNSVECAPRLLNVYLSDWLLATLDSLLRVETVRPVVEHLIKLGGSYQDYLCNNMYVYRSAQVCELHFKEHPYVISDTNGMQLFETDSIRYCHYLLVDICDYIDDMQL